MKAIQLTLLSIILLAVPACEWEASWEIGDGIPSAPSQSTSPAGTGTVTKAELRAEPAGQGPSSSFGPDTPKIICEWTVEDVTAGTEISGVWVAVDSGGVAPPNYRIDEAKLTLSGPMSGTFSITKPTKGWPKGRYQLEIYLDGKLAKTVPFTIEEQRSVDLRRLLKGSTADKARKDCAGAAAPGRM